MSKCDTDSCMICQSRLTIPVRFVKKNPPCECDYYLCDHCAQSYVDHCKQSNSPIKCIICKECVIGDPVYDPSTGKKKHAYFIKDIKLLVRLDEKYKELIKCLKCNKWSGSRLNYITTHEGECDEIHVTCQYCNTNAPRKDIKIHEQICPGRVIQCEKCKTNVRLSEKENHIQTCPETLINCKWCNQNIKRVNMIAHLTTCKDEYPKILWEHIRKIEQVLLKHNITIE